MIPSDTLYGSQWHFSLMGTRGGELLINRIWNEFDGGGIYVGVYDDGVEINHFDLNDNYNSSLHVNIGGGAISGDAVNADETHGTSVAGLIAAEANGQDSVGVAFGADITGVNIFRATGPFYINAADPSGFFAAVRAGTQFHVTNHSWGSSPFFDPSQNQNVAGSFAAELISAYDHLVDTGRYGLGTVIVQAAGNEAAQADGDSVNGTRFTITVGAIHNDGYASSYSNYGASLLVSAAGGDFAEVRSGLGTVSADRTGTVGYNLRSNATGNFAYTDDFGGTSSATPIVSGVVALMLDANPYLGWRDVSNILAASADHTGGDYFVASPPVFEENNTWFINGAGNWNGGGMHFSEDYGYGRVNAFAAVRMAEAWTLFGPSQVSTNEVSVSSGLRNVNQSIPDQGVRTYQFNVVGNLLLEHVAFTMTLSHTYMPDLRIFLVSPAGTEVQLYDGSDANGTDPGYPDITGGTTWTFGIEAFRGETIAGNWTVRVEDAAAADSGFLTSVSLEGFGTTPSVNDVYHYTDEYSELVPLYGGRFALSDFDGGTDWINAAAVTDNVNLNFSSGERSTIDGETFVIAAGTTIENAVTGDGNDTITGNGANNRLYGMRGNDTMRGNGGDDAMYGGTGNDVLIGGAGQDYLDGGDGFDWASYETSTVGVRADMVFRSQNTGDVVGDSFVSIEGLRGSAQNDILYSTEGADTVEGGDGQDLMWTRGGNDRLFGKGGNDSMYGRENDDLMVGGAGMDYMDGGDGFDTVSYEDSASGVIVDLVFRSGNTGDAVGDTFVNIEALTGSNHNDTLTATTGNDTITGLAGADYINARSGSDTLYGGAGTDQIYAGDGNDYLEGGADADYMDGGNDADTAGYIGAAAGVQVDMLLQNTNTGEAAGDFLFQIENLFGSAHNDRLLGTEGDNILTGHTGDDMLWARGGNDTLNGGDGLDLLYGLSGTDTLSGGTGNDLLDGGLNNDTLTGGTGNDTFRFTEVAFGTDTITDFEDNLDKLSFSLTIADAFNDFVISNNGTTSVTVAIGSQSVTVNGTAPITLTATDFVFQN